MSKNHVEIEIIHRDHALVTIPESDFVSMSLLDSILRMLPEQPPSPVLASRTVKTPSEKSPPLLDLGFEEPTPPAAKTSRCSPVKQRIALNIQERIRALTPVQQRKTAATGEQSERVALERMYGKTVWEALLRNPKLTPPEAARIARMAALPRPLLELIANHRGWLTSPQVRRALLANHRLSKELAMTVLRALPRSELKLMPKQVSYPPLIRELAAKMLK